MSEPSSGGNSVRVHAAAKVNLTLHVTGKRDDGYHLLESLIGFTTITDQIDLLLADEIALSVDGPEAHSLQTESGNLVTRAAELMQRCSQTSTGVSIRLDKHIPVSAGLGGGSADAAAVVNGCARLWNIPADLIPDDETLAAALGADVPVCRLGQGAWVSGIGERLDPAPAWPELWLVLVNPRVPVPTADVFRAFDGPFQVPEAAADGWPNWGDSIDDFVGFLAARTNSLTGPALTVAPVIEYVLAALETQETCLLARMSGSGPTCFGLFADADTAATSAQVLAEQAPGWWVRPSPLICQT